MVPLRRAERRNVLEAFRPAAGIEMEDVAARMNVACVGRSTMEPTMANYCRIRHATPGDAESLAVLAERTFRDTFAGDNSPDDIAAYVRESFSHVRIRSELANDANTFVLAFVVGTEAPVGYAKLRTGTSDASVTGPDPVELQRLYVDRSSIGSGIGAALMRASLGAARLAGHRTIWLGVWERNARAIAFYERSRFLEVGDHVFQLGSDAQRDLIMARSVLQSE